MYIEMKICKFMKAQRMGNWLLHLEAISEMLPFFASSGHYLYAKSAYLYLQSLTKCFLMGTMWSGGVIVIGQVYLLTSSRIDANIEINWWDDTWQGNE